MTDPQPIQINITRNANSLGLPTVPTELSQPGDFIEWIFEGVGANETVHIEFTSPPSGPLQSLATDRDRVLGLGNTGQQGEFPYTATIRDSESNVVAGGQAVVKNLSDKNISPFATVTVNMDTPDIQPRILQVAVFEDATWTSHDLPPGAHLEFNIPDNTFQSFDPGEPQDGVQVARGTRLMATSTVHYTVWIVTRQQKVIGPFDPVIEPLGWPPPDRG